MDGIAEGDTLQVRISSMVIRLDGALKSTMTDYILYEKQEIMKIMILLKEAEKVLLETT